MNSYRNYFLTGIKIELPLQGFNDDKYIEFPEIFNNDKISFYLIPITNAEQGKFERKLFTKGMICLKTNGHHIDLTEAKYLFHSLESAFLLYFFCIAKDTSDDWSIFPLSSSMLKTKLPWTLDDFITHNVAEINQPYYPSIKEFERSFSTNSYETLSSIKEMFKVARLQLIDPVYHNASSYLYLSIKKLGIDVCNWRDSGYDPKFDEYINMGIRESCFQDAYKSIEVILGDAGGLKNRDRRLTAKLISLGIDSQEQVGYKTKEKLLTKLLRFVDIRDKLSAHGSSPKKMIQLSDIIDVQACARYLITSKLV